MKWIHGILSKLLLFVCLTYHANSGKENTTYLCDQYVLETQRLMSATLAVLAKLQWDEIIIIREEMNFNQRWHILEDGIVETGISIQVYTIGHNMSEEINFILDAYSNAELKESHFIIMCGVECVRTILEEINRHENR